MDRVQDRGVEWRNDIQDFLFDMGIGVLNPCDKPINWGLENENSRQWRQQSLIQASELYKQGLIHDANKICEAIHEHMRDVVASDLRCIDKSDATILYVDTDVHMCGSYGEQTHACLQRKPVIVFCKQGKFNIPDWLWGICQHEMFFSTLEEVKWYIEHVAYDDNIKHYKRWRFFDFKKMYGRDRYRLSDE